MELLIVSCRLSRERNFLNKVKGGWIFSFDSSLSGFNIEKDFDNYWVVSYKGCYRKAPKNMVVNISDDEISVFKYFNRSVTDEELNSLKGEMLSTIKESILKEKENYLLNFNNKMRVLENITRDI